MKKYFLLMLPLVFIIGGYFYYAGKPGGPSTVSAADVCVEHRLPEADCPFCDKGLIERKGMCAEHGVPEALCYQCNPALIAAFKSIDDWCGEHSRPESQCDICNPQARANTTLPVEKPALPSLEQDSPVLLVPAAEVPRSKRAPVQCDTEKLRVQFNSPETAKNAGLEFALTQRLALTEMLKCSTEISYNNNRYATISPRAAGVVRSVYKDLGDKVAGGETMAVLDCAEAAKAKAEYLEAMAFLKAAQEAYEREERLLELHVGTEQERLEAEKELARSKIALSNNLQNLKNLGISDAEIKGTIEKQDTASLLRIKAPFAATIIARNATPGEVVDVSRPIFQISDTSTVWAMLHVKEAESKKILVGQPVTVSVDSLPGETFGGSITWVSSEIDPKTRTLKARAEIKNAEGLLRANMFGKAEISVKDKKPSIVVPKEAVQWEGCCNIVFVRESETLFEPRKVRLGYETERFYVAEKGLDINEVVVTIGSFLLKTEILKGSIGAGCCEIGDDKRAES